MTSQKDLGESKLNNFDFIRLLAASMVVFSHSFELLTLPEPLKRLNSENITFGSIGVYTFFSISGFLITQSLFRSSSYKTYFAKRSLRIFPALIVDVLIAVFIWGPIVTTLTLGHYFSNKDTYFYLTNIFLYRIVYTLPGVFTNNIGSNIVNGSLWTLPHEFTCYFGIVILHFFYILKNKYVYTIAYFCYLVGWIILSQTKYADALLPIVKLQAREFFTLSLYFGAGALFFLWRDKIVFKYYVSIILLIIWIISFYFGLAAILGFFCLPYIVLWFVFEPKIRLHNVGKLGDFSYGMYIYSFPMQQTIIHFLGGNISWWLMCALSFLLTIPMAVFSWFMIEKKCLKIKDRIFNVKSY